MGFILDLASGEKLTDEPGYTCGRATGTLEVARQHTLQAPRLRLALAEHAITERQISPIAGLDMAALINSIED